MNPNTTGFPFIKLTVQGMEQTVYHALSDYQVLMDENLRAAVKEYCSPENIKKLVDVEARQQIDRAVKDAVRHYFLYTGGGHDIIKKRINEILDEDLKWMLGDKSK